MTALPQGTVTFLFTDVEGSTRLLQKHGDRYADLLAEHRRVLRGAFARHGGVEVDTQGDAFFVAFGKASAALAAAADGRDALGRGPIRVRMGVHTGEPLVTDEGYVGIDVHRAARIAGAGHGGQIPLSQRARARMHRVYALALLARVAAETGELERAGLLWAAVEAEERAGPIGQWEDERDAYAAPVLAYAGVDFDRGLASGRDMTLDEIVARVLS